MRAGRNKAHSEDQLWQKRALSRPTLSTFHDNVRLSLQHASSLLGMRKTRYVHWNYGAWTEKACDLLVEWLFAAHVTNDWLR